MNALIDFEEAFRLVCEAARPLGTEVLPITQLLGRTLALPARARCDLPPFDNSAVDGYAVSHADLGTTTLGKSFRLTGVLHAGAREKLGISSGEAVRVFTGAPLPAETGAVVMQEAAQESDGSVTFNEPIAPGSHLRQQGSEARAGDVIVEPSLVNPIVIGALAAAGVAEAEVYRRPQVGMVISGDELVSLENPLGPGQIYESNGHALTAAIQNLGLPEPIILRSNDTLDQLTEKLETLLQRCDVVLTSGGVSVGDHDFVRPALARLGVETVFWGVAVKPGKPFYFGHHQRGVVFGLPGNPVSAMTIFALFVRPYLRIASGRDHGVARRSLTLTATLQKSPGRTEFVPCRIDHDKAHPMVGRASHKSSALAQANGFVVFGSSESCLEAGTSVEVIELQWGWNS